MTQLKAVLRVEREDATLCVETPRPAFSWRLEAPERGCRQRSYRLTVSAGKGGVLWDTGDVPGRAMTATYDGAPIPPETTCRAALTVRDELGRTAEAAAEFRTGLCAAGFDDPAWGGARWIGTGTRDLRADALFVYELSCAVRLTEADAAGIIFGADDPRLMDNDRNLMGTEAKPGESYLYLRLDTAPLDRGEAARVEIRRAGYAPGDDPETPIHSLAVPPELLDQANRREEHRLKIRCNNSMADVYLDGGHLNPRPADPNPFASGALNLSPGEGGNDFTCYGALCRAGVRAEGGAAVFRGLEVRNFRTPGSLLWRAMEEPERIGGERRFDPEIGGMPMVRREFDARGVVRAWLTITARGVYEAYINGQKAGEDFLAPGLTQYTKTHMYQVYDVTGLIREGRNAVGLSLGEGWWSGPVSFAGENGNYFGDMQSVIAKLTLERADGTAETLVTDGSWQASSDGLIRHGSLFQGEVWDARREPRGWTEPGFDGAWPGAEVIDLTPENAALGQVMGPFGPQDMDHAPDACRGQIGGGVKCVGRLPALSVTEPRPGVFVYDFGQNIAGVPEIALPAAPGAAVTLRYGEILYPALPEYADLQGMLMVENLRAAHATDRVILGAEPILFRPRFTFHGFRYMELTGLSEPVPVKDVAALALSSAGELTADYRTSDGDVDRLFRNIQWSLRDNFLSIPTDCPQRNERMGWSGDLSVFSRTAVYLTDGDAFLRRHMMAMRDLQRADGMFPDIAPIGGGFGGVLWGSAGMTVPWEAYLQYGDRRILEEHYDAMVRYMEYLERHVDPDTGLQTAGELGDWLGPQNGKTENGLLWTAYYIYDLDIMARTAELLGRPEEEKYRDLREDARRRFAAVYLDGTTGQTVYSSEDAAHGNRMFFEPIDRTGPLPPKAPGGAYIMDTQTSYCAPLALDCVPEELAAAAGECLARACERENTDDRSRLCPPCSLMTGFIGTAWILPALTMTGRDDIAYRMLLNRAFPSWLYPVIQGATTIWERLDSFTVEDGFGGHNSMNSFNHYSFGAVGQWLISRSLGIARDEPGFARFLLCPAPDVTGGLTWAEGWYLSPAGRIESGWRAIPGGWEYRFTVPANTECELRLPGGPEAVVRENGGAPEQAEGVTVMGYGDGIHCFRLESGTYRFTVTS